MKRILIKMGGNSPHARYALRSFDSPIESPAWFRSLSLKTTRERLIERVLEGQNDRQTIWDQSHEVYRRLSPELSDSSGAYHPYHITKAYPIKALCCIASTFSLATFHCILWLESFHIRFSFGHRIFILHFIAGGHFSLGFHFFSYYFSSQVAFH